MLTIMRPLLLTLGIAIMSIPAHAQDNGEALRQGWGWWKSISESAREQLAPALVKAAGKTGGAIRLGVAGVDNLTRYRALCGRKSGSFRDTPLCKALQFDLGQRSAMSTILLGLHRRAGMQNAPARDAAAILVGLQQALGIDRQGLPALPQHLISGLYEELGRCAPPACLPAQVQGSALRGWLVAAAALAVANGSDTEAEAGRRLQALGWK